MIKIEDLIIDVYRVGCAFVNVPETGVRITHKPSGIVVESSNERSQFKNKEKCIKEIEAKLLIQ